MPQDACGSQGDLLSVIVTSHNHGPYLEECLKSVLEQTYRPLEILVAEDASMDGSAEMVREFEAKNPGVLRGLFSASNLGVARNRHRAIQEAKGDWFVTLDGDDSFHNPFKLQHEMDVVHRHVALDGKGVAAYSNILLVEDEGRSKSLQGNSGNLREGNILSDILGRSCMIPRDYIAPRAAYFEVGGYDCAIPIYEDWDLKIRLAEIIPFHYSGSVGTAYRRHGRGLSAAPPTEHRKWLEHIFEKNIHRIAVEDRERVTLQFSSFLSRIS